MRKRWRSVWSFIRRVRGVAIQSVGACLCAVLALVAAATQVPQAGAAADADPGASAFIREFGAQSIQELTDPAMPEAEREVRFRRLLVEHFDLAAMAKFVLGRYWRSTSEAQRSDFKRAFEDFIVHSYAARFGEYHGVGFQVVGSTVDTGGAIVVHSRVRTSKTEEALLDWHLRVVDKRFMIVDIVVEGVSMVVTQRSDFGSIIQHSGGVDGLIRALRAKNAEPVGARVAP